MRSGSVLLVRSRDNCKNYYSNVILSECQSAYRICSHLPLFGERNVHSVPKIGNDRQILNINKFEVDYRWLPVVMLSSEQLKVGEGSLGVVEMDTMWTLKFRQLTLIYS